MKATLRSALTSDRNIAVKEMSLESGKVTWLSRQLADRKGRSVNVSRARDHMTITLVSYR